MPYPKEKIASANEYSMIDWLRKNEPLLPLTLYRLAKKLNWTFGATRGTLLRLVENPANKIIIANIVDRQTKKFKTKVALRGTPSESKLQKEASLNTDQRLKGPSSQAFPKEAIIELLQMLKELDEKVSILVKFINDAEVLQKFLELEFGLESDQKEELLSIIQQLEEN